MIWDQILLALSPDLLLACLVGVTLGIIWGAMPGLSTTIDDNPDPLSASTPKEALALAIKFLGGLK